MNRQDAKTLGPHQEHDRVARPVHEAQALHPELSGHRLGFLIEFHVVRIKKGAPLHGVVALISWRLGALAVQ
jgi:hypothetical protein